MAGIQVSKHYAFAIRAMADISGTLLVPPLLMLLARRLYDHLAYEAIVFYFSLIVVFVLSMVMIVKKAQRYGQEFQKLTQTAPGDDRGAGS